MLESQKREGKMVGQPTNPPIGGTSLTLQPSNWQAKNELGQNGLG